MDEKYEISLIFDLISDRIFVRGLQTENMNGSCDPRQIKGMGKEVL